MKKKRADSVLDKLPPNQRATLEGWLFTDNLSYADAVKKLWEDFNVRVAPSSLSSFWQECSQRRLLDRIAASAQNANLVVDRLKQNPADMDAAMRGMVGQITFDASMQQGEKFDPEFVFNFTKLMIAWKKANAQAEELSLAREKFEMDASEKMLNKAIRAAADEINASNLSNADKIAAMRREAFKSVDDLEKSGKVKIPK